MIGLLLGRELTMVLRRSGFHVLLATQAILGLALVFVADAAVRRLGPSAPPSLGTAITATSPAPPPNPLASSSDTLLLFGWAFWLVLACALAMPALAGSAISREREHGTLSVVLGSGASPAALVAAKLTGAIVLMAGLVAAGLPALALALVFGTPPLEAVAASGLVVLAWGCLAAAVGVVASSLARSAVGGIVGAIIAVVALLAVAVAVPALAPSLGVTLPSLAGELNPLAAVLLVEPGAGQRVAEQLSASAWLSVVTTDSGLGGRGWWPFVAASLALCALLAGAASLIIGRSASDT